MGYYNAGNTRYCVFLCAITQDVYIIFGGTEMRLGGLQKLTLLDFPGHVACTVFTQGCNFRCPFCHNTPLVTGTEDPEYPLEDFFRFLETRQGILDGVAITGGEPLLHRDIGGFMRRIRDLGFAVKLDTNGAFPDLLRQLIEEGLVDYVAMDIKNSPEKYERTAGVSGIFPAVQKSAALLMKNRVAYEFRTTLVDELHEPEDFEAIGKWLQGTENYFIQHFVDSGNILTAGMHEASSEKTMRCLAAARKYLPEAALRGTEEKKEK